MTCDMNYKMKSVLLLKLLRQRFHRKQPKIHDVLYGAGIRTLDPKLAWQTRDALDLMSNYFEDLTFFDYLMNLFWQIIFLSQRIILYVFTLWRLKLDWRSDGREILSKRWRCARAKGSTDWRRKNLSIFNGWGGRLRAHWNCTILRIVRYLTHLSCRLQKHIFCNLASAGTPHCAYR